jgi:hypothetical protein
MVQRGAIFPILKLENLTFFKHLKQFFLQSKATIIMLNSNIDVYFSAYLSIELSVPS